MKYPYQMMQLPYAFDALEPVIDAKTMDIHYNKHYKGYLDKFNKVFEHMTDYHDKSFEELLCNLDSLPVIAHDGIRDFGGGVYNHELFWNVMSPKKQKPSEYFLKKIDMNFGSLMSFNEEFNKEANYIFGSGWAWLCTDKTGKLALMGTKNQNSPLEEGLYPILCIDVWEHAYYLKYQNRRAEFVADFWRIINWEYVEKRYQNYIK